MSEKEGIERFKVSRFINNLDLGGISQMAEQLVLYPESRKFLLNAIEEFEKFYQFPIKTKETKKEWV